MPKIVFLPLKFPTIINLGLEANIQKNAIKCEMVLELTQMKSNCWTGLSGANPKH